MGNVQISMNLCDQILHLIVGIEKTNHSLSSSYQTNSNN